MTVGGGGFLVLFLLFLVKILKTFQVLARFYYYSWSCNNTNNLLIYDFIECRNEIRIHLPSAHKDEREGEL